MGLLNTSVKRKEVQKIQVTRVSSYEMEIYHQRFILLVHYVILPVAHTSIQPYLMQLGQMKIPVYQVVIVYMEIMPMPMTNILLYGSSIS